MITMYGKGPGQCRFCDLAKIWLDLNGLEYEVIDVTKDADAYAFIKTNYGTVPQFFFPGTTQLLVAGGYTGLVKAGPEAIRALLGK